MRCPAMIVALSFMTFVNATAQLPRIEDPAKGDSVGILTFAAGTTLADVPGEVSSYEGEWKNGLAHGDGLLRFRTPEAFLSEGTRPQISYYLGKFADGRPAGGDLVQPAGSRQLRFSGVYGEGQIVVSVDGQEIVVATPLADGKVIVRMMQYPNSGSRMPSRIFFGESIDGVPHGEWVDVPWYEEEAGEVRAGYGPYFEGSKPNGATISCKHEPRRPDPPTLLQDLTGSRGSWVQALAGLDVQYAAPATCVVKNPEGWTFNAVTDHSSIVPTLRYVSCANPAGRAGTLSGQTCTYQNRRRNYDVFTNIGREFKRFVDRRVLGTIDRGGASMEKALCRATGTEPGRNCNVSMSVGVSWPVGEPGASNAPAPDDEARQRFAAAANRAAQLPSAFDDALLGEAAGITGELNAVCVSLCQTASQRAYSANLLAELERVANQPRSDNTVRSIASVNRETASVLSGGIRLLTVVAGPAIAFYRFSESARLQVRISTAIDAVRALPDGPTRFAEEKRKNDALAVLYRLQWAQMSQMASDGVNLLGEAVKANIRLLRGLPPQRVRALTVAITIGRSKQQVEAFIEKYKDVNSEAELYDAVIRETVAPLGITWPPPQQ